MTWIKTVPFDEAGEELRRAWEKQRDLYPPEYGESVPAAETRGEEMSGVVG